MQKFFAMVLSLVLILMFTGCNKHKTNMEISQFSYSEEAEIYTEDSPGVKHNGFINTSETIIQTGEDAVETAKNECTVEWDTTQVYFDSELSIWKVLFYTEGMLGGDQCVYLDNNGKTMLIVYGE